jgi:hypothetical protein
VAGTCRGLERSLSERHIHGMAGERHGVCESQSHITSRGPQRIPYMLLVVDQNGYPPHIDIEGSRGVAPLILKLSTRWRWLTSRPDRFTATRALDGPHIRFGRFQEEENLPPASFPCSLSLPQGRIRRVCQNVVNSVCSHF